LVIGFGIGFVFANSVNRRETEQLRAELSSSVQNTQRLFPAEGALAASATPAEVSNEEMQAAIARADADPRDIFLQRNLGQYLYLYSAQPGGAKILPDAIRLLERAYRNDPDNYDTLVLLGNANFNLAQATDAKRFAEARTFYEKALRVKPRDARVRIDLGLTYLYGDPSDPRRAIAEYERALAIEPRNEAATQNLAAALIGAGEIERAQQTLEQLRQLNPNNPVVSDLKAQLAGRINETK
jgi:tetratricopeptide (TPR) repeat protein